MLNLSRVDVLVFAPHPDDEVIGCFEVIRRALADGERIRVVFVTSGDGYPRAAARLFGKPEARLTEDDMIRLGHAREAEAAAAARVMGLTAADLVFLRYPDAGLATLSSARRVAATRDVKRLLDDSRPARVYVTDHADEHPDHRVTNELVLTSARASRFEGELFTFIVHSGGDVHWPPAGRVYSTVKVGTVTFPEAVGWPPPVRLPLAQRSSEAKLRALKAHASQWALDHAYLRKFVKSEEVFWKPA